MNHRAFTVDNFFLNNESIVVTQRQFRTRLNLNFSHFFTYRFQLLQKTPGEARFLMCDFVIKQNCHYWSRESPKEIQQIPLHSQKGTLFFADENEGNTVVQFGEHVEKFFQREFSGVPGLTNIHKLNEID